MPYDYENEPSFRADPQAAQGLPERDARQARGTEHQGRRDRAAREARPQRPLPMRLRKEISSAAASPPTGFDGAERRDYWR